MADSTFVAKDGNAVNIAIAAQYDAVGDRYYPINLLPTKTMISRRADSIGDGTGTNEITGNYSGAATDFIIAPAAGEVFHILRMIGYVRDTGAFRAEWYGSSAALTNGIQIIHKFNGVEIDLTADEPVRYLAEWAGYCHDLSVQDFGAGDDFASWRWTFANAGIALALDGDNGDRMIVRVNDNMTGLNEHHFTFQGYQFS